MGGQEGKSYIGTLVRTMHVLAVPSAIGQRPLAQLADVAGWRRDGIFTNKSQEPRARNKIPICEPWANRVAGPAFVSGSDLSSLAARCSQLLVKSPDLPGLLTDQCSSRPGKLVRSRRSLLLTFLVPVLPVLGGRSKIFRHNNAWHVATPPTTTTNDRRVCSHYLADPNGPKAVPLDTHGAVPRAAKAGPLTKKALQPNHWSRCKAG